MKHAPNLRRFRLALDLRGNAKHICGDRPRPLLPSPLTDVTRAFFARHAIPAPLVAFYEENAFTEMVTFGQNRFWAANDLADQNAIAGEPWFVEEARFLAVGTGPGGSPVVVDLADGGTVGFFEHSEYYWHADIFGDPSDPEAREERGPARERYVATPFDLGSFFLADALCGYDAKREGDGAYFESRRSFTCDNYGAEEDAKLGWNIFEEGMAAWESGQTKLAGLAYPIALG